MMNKLISLLSNKKYFPIKSQGKSMLPILQPGDLVYYKKIAFNKCRVNDLVMVRKEKITFTHRVIYKTNKFLITKGDNSLNADGRVYPRQIIGKVYQVKRNSKVFNPEDLYLIQSSLYFAEIVKIKKALEKERIDFVFLKGLPLHLYFEKSHPRRIYADCDVLIDQNDFAKVEKIMNSSGYAKIDNSISRLHRKFKKTINEINYIKYVNKYPIIFDIHLKAFVLISQMDNLNELYDTSLINNMSCDFLNDKQILTINNEKFPTLSSVNLTIFLCLHYLSHNFCGAYRLEFLDRVIRKALSNPPPGRSPFGHLPGVLLAYKLQNFVYPVFLLLKKYYQTPLPTTLLNSIKQWNNGTMKQYLNINIFDDEPRIKAGVTRFKNLFFLSPNPWWRRLLIIFNLQVIYSVLWVIIRRLRNLPKPRF